MTFGELKNGDTFRLGESGFIWMKTGFRDGIQIRPGAFGGIFDLESSVIPITMKVDDGTPDPKTAAELARMIGEFRTARKDLLAVISLKTNNGKFSKEFDAETEWVISGRFPKPVTFGDLKTGEPFGIPGVDRSALCKIEQGHAMNLAGVVGARCGFMDSITVTRLTWREVADILEGAKEKVNG